MLIMQVEVDGVDFDLPLGATVLDATRAAGAFVPTLCFDQRQMPFGACRVCLVGVEGAAGPLPACTTLCREGMRINTQDEQALRVARGIVELVLSELPEPPGETTELGVISGALGAAAQRWPGPAHEGGEEDLRHPYLALRHGLCISCGRCIRACDEVQGAFALTATGRGFHANVAAGLDEGFLDSACVACGACADTCPTDAITEIRLIEEGLV